MALGGTWATSPPLVQRSFPSSKWGGRCHLPSRLIWKWKMLPKGIEMSKHRPQQHPIVSLGGLIETVPPRSSSSSSPQASTSPLWTGQHRRNEQRRVQKTKPLRLIPSWLGEGRIWAGARKGPA